MRRNPSIFAASQVYYLLCTILLVKGASAIRILISAFHLPQAQFRHRTNSAGYTPTRNQYSSSLSLFLNGKSNNVNKDEGSNGPNGNQEAASTTNNNNKVMMKNNNMTVDFRLHASIFEIPAHDWDSCVNQDGSPISPFMQHTFLSSLEKSQCVSSEAGWVPRHVSIQINNITQGFAPMYLKFHSLGEFIFDSAWAEASYQNGIDYYPKLLVAVPFTPATGQRILWRSSFLNSDEKNDVAVTSKGLSERQQPQPQLLTQLRRAFGQYLRQLAASSNLSSVHINFLTDAEANDLAGPLNVKVTAPPASQGGGEASSSSSSTSTLQRQVANMLERFNQPPQNNLDDFIRRTSVQYHWINRNPQNHNKPFVSFDDYLTSSFKSKRRISIRRERRRVLQEENIRIHVLQGAAAIRSVPGLVKRMFEIYQATIQKMTIWGWGRQYLSLEFFELLVASDSFCDNLCFVCARRHNNETATAAANGKDERSGDETAGNDNSFCAEDVFAGTINIIKDGVFYGRYWGCLPGMQIPNLHFEVCYWQSIEYCIRQGLKRAEPGAGGGDYKWARGFDPALVHSVHYIRNPLLRRAIRQYVDYETENNVELMDCLKWKRKGKHTQAATVAPA